MRRLGGGGGEVKMAHFAISVIIGQTCIFFNSHFDPHA